MRANAAKAKPKPVTFSSVDPIFREALEEGFSKTPEELVARMEFIRLGRRMDAVNRRRVALLEKFNAAVKANDIEAAVLIQADGIRLDREWDSLYLKRFGRTPEEARMEYAAEDAKPQPAVEERSANK